MRISKIIQPDAARKTIKRFLIVALVGCGAIFALDKKFPDKFYDCGRDTKDLHGGDRNYEGKSYNLILCGTGGDENFMHDKIRLQIFSEQGELLAQRKFYVDWITNFPRELEYGADSVTYYDASQESNFKHRIEMPPTRWDWVRARLPLLS